jgi:hypothetical protein
MSLEWIITLAATGVGAVLMATSVWRTSRPRRDSLRARWVPWRFLILVSGAILFLALIHLVTLLGLRGAAR